MSKPPRSRSALVMKVKPRPKQGKNYSSFPSGLLQIQSAVAGANQAEIDGFSSRIMEKIKELQSAVSELRP